MAPKAMVLRRPNQRLITCAPAWQSALNGLRKWAKNNDHSLDTSNDDDAD